MCLLFRFNLNQAVVAHSVHAVSSVFVLDNLKVSSEVDVVANHFKHFFFVHCLLSFGFASITGPEMFYYKLCEFFLINECAVHITVFGVCYVEKNEIAEFFRAVPLVVFLFENAHAIFLVDPQDIVVVLFVEINCQVG